MSSIWAPGTSVCISLILVTFHIWSLFAISVTVIFSAVSSRLSVRGLQKQFSERIGRLSASSPTTCSIVYSCSQNRPACMTIWSNATLRSYNQYFFLQRLLSLLLLSMKSFPSPCTAMPSKCPALEHLRIGMCSCDCAIVQSTSLKILTSEGNSVALFTEYAHKLELLLSHCYVPTADKFAIRNCPCVYVTRKMKQRGICVWTSATPKKCGRRSGLGFRSLCQIKWSVEVSFEAWWPRKPMWGRLLRRNTAAILMYTVSMAIVGKEDQAGGSSNKIVCCLGRF